MMIMLIIIMIQIMETDDEAVNNNIIYHNTQIYLKMHYLEIYIKEI